ncbi:SDR family oxidoreductase [Mesorhizobium sp. LHD-90]|uniref:SDR family oxidoreductase n=1 Tax=Mesorhizobium sp. LHD-90 TaxID=3071414 RepID=UPI0027E1A427|nr:SDR family oxidoreductase [Mesorhizobium sp. LHD-90]MDQ6434989.1 SDR family oxidoreductase [Mesorhizobium sp. LHD-90]
MAHVIITGGSSGIGAALAEACAARGDAVSLIARSQSPLDDARARLNALFGKSGGRFHAEAADVGEAAAIAAAIGRCEAALGPCETLICSAGIVAPGRFEDQPADAFENQIRTNLFGTVNAVRAVYPGMLARRSGKILMIGSGAGLIGIFGYTAYCASKYAVAGFAEALRAEARPCGITVSICFPPDTETPQLVAERPMRPREAEATIGTAGLWSAPAVARAALAGLDRGRFAIYPGMQMKMLGMFGSVAMPFLRPWFDRRIAATRPTFTEKS